MRIIEKFLHSRVYGSAIGDKLAIILADHKELVFGNRCR
jgi:hypothetical protein